MTARDSAQSAAYASKPSASPRPVDERLQRIDSRIDRAVEHHRAHSIGKEFRVLRAEQRP